MATIQSIYLIFYIFALFLISLFVFLIIYAIIKRINVSLPPGKQPVNLYVPCKYGSETFEKNIKSILSQNYPDLSMYFIVGSKKDSAYCTLKKIVKNHKVLIAGETKTRSQKNHNLLYGIKHSRKSKIYAFFDSDAHFDKNALSKLIGGMADREKTVATSFPKKTSKDHNLAETVYSLYYGAQYILCSSFKAVWGGYYAIYGEDFINLGVKEIWEKSVSDDVPLTRILIENKYAVKFIKKVGIFDSNVHRKIGPTFCWIQRQTLMLKHYLRVYWIYTILFVACVILINIILLTITIIYSSINKLILGLMLFFAISLIIHLINRIINRNADFLDDIKYALPALAILCAAVLSTLFISDVVWGGHTYKISKGAVKQTICLKT